MGYIQANQPNDNDINSVLDRFKAWNGGLERAPEPATPAFAGLREMTYEEALGPRRVRRVLPRIPAGGLPALNMESNAADAHVVKAPPSAKAIRQSSSDDSLKMRQTMADPMPSNQANKLEASTPGVPPAKLQKKRTRSRRVPQSPVDKVSALVWSAAKVDSDAAHASVESKGAAAIHPAKRRRRKALATPFTETALTNRMEATADAGQSGPTRTFKSYMDTSLATQTRPRNRNPDPVAYEPAGHAIPSMVPWVEAKAVSLKLRISAQEHAKIRAGAEEAGVPLDAYMRQCTLDVQVLRKLLKQTIADIKTFDAPLAQRQPQPGMAAKPPASQMSAATLLPTPARNGLFSKLKAIWSEKQGKSA